MRDNQRVKTILILAANPKNTSRLRLDKEVQEIDEGLRRANKREQFKLEQRWAVRSHDFYRAILDTQPQIVHFCGHGAGEDGIVLEDETGEAALVQAHELASMFRLFASESVECVVLNACYSEGQAQAIAQHVGYVIGTNRTIGDNAAIAFSRAFYDALAAGKTIEYAFELGSACLVGFSEHQTPVLKKKSQDELSALKKGIEKLPDTKPTERKHIFISYKRNADPDEAVAIELYHSLSQHHEVFIDQRMMVGTRWAECIEKQLRQSDFLIVFLSSHSVHSEMVGLEIQRAHELGQLQGGRPAILPVRLAYREQFQYPLSAYLDPINWAFWQDDSDTPRLIAELTQAISGGELSIGEAQKPSLLKAIEASPFPRPFPSAQLEMPEGTMDSESQFYVERPCDAIALGTIEQKGVTIAIKGPRQVGKSSLLIRIKETAEKAGKRVAFLDFQLFDKAALQDGELFFRQFCTWVTDELEMEDRVDEYWSSPLGNSQRCTRYVSRHILKGLGKQPLVLAMDEVDKVFDAEFRNDFFGMLRSWHNCRATTPIWKNFDLTLVTSTEPYQLIDDLNQSPFNVGQVIEMGDFSPEQVADLNQRHGLPFNPSEERRLIGLLGGHPYLIRRSLYLIASQQISPSELFANATYDSGPFGDHLRHHLSLLHNKTELIQGLLEIIRQNNCADKRIFWRLRGAGLVREEGKAIVPRCQLYAEYFRENLRE
ncbi:TIR domain-containing protein [Scytonema sp. UIC 10036]|uniref:AAA-like domain-containing protein n=1 Tax=Scytonema sp. UIC 10036 TaxID=2304196 RepID=UPI0012DA339F|nr:AAA-like domain-containing protein [Scytonema sp. UIC 10036]MUG92060.1 TIR domain-containing protein [Scytonema sp. UIC 10036]